MSEKLTFRSNGKLLITGEYVVLDGAKALAIPTRRGQSMEVTYLDSNTSEIFWKAFDSDGMVWIETTLNYKEQTSTSKTTEALQLLKILQHPLVQKVLKEFNDRSFQIDTYLEFPKDWGLGTSSTLINNIAEWLNIDAYQLQDDIFGGSGYDIACAQYHDPITYQLTKNHRKIEVVELSEDIINHLYFVYLNKKQNSREGIAHYKKNLPSKLQIEEISYLTDELLLAQELETFESLIKTHNEKLSQILQMPSAQEQFSDCPYTLKYLGAWGGDFMMVVSKEKIHPYFNDKGFDVVLNYRELI